MPWSKQNTDHSLISKDHFYQDLGDNPFKYKYKSLCGHFYIERITPNRKPTNKCKICDKIWRKKNY